MIRGHAWRVLHRLTCGCQTNKNGVCEMGESNSGSSETNQATLDDEEEGYVETVGEAPDSRRYRGTTWERQAELLKMLRQRLGFGVW